MWQTLQMVSRRHLQWTNGWWLSHQPPSSQNSAGQPDSVCPAHCIKEGSRLCLGRSFESSLVDFRRKHWDIVLLSGALIVELWSRKHGPSLSFCIGLLFPPSFAFLNSLVFSKTFSIFQSYVKSISHAKQIAARLDANAGVGQWFSTGLTWLDLSARWGDALHGTSIRPARLSMWSGRTTLPSSHLFPIPSSSLHLLWSVTRRSHLKPDKTLWPLGPHVGLVLCVCQLYTWASVPNACRCILYKLQWWQQTGSDVDMPTDWLR